MTVFKNIEKCKKKKNVRKKRFIKQQLKDL